MAGDRPGRRRTTAATGVLAATWVVLGLVLWLIMVVEPVVLPIWFYVPGLVVTVGFGIILVASTRWGTLWERVFVPRVALPTWTWLAAGAILVVVVVLSASFRMSTGGALATGAFVVAALYLLVQLNPIRRLNRLIQWPVWVVIAGSAFVALVVGLTIIVEEGTLLSAIFLIALLLFTFHVVIILPLTLFEVIQAPADGELTTYPLVSVLIPAYNEETKIVDCLEAVCASTYPSDLLEVIVVDDGSTDRTYAVAAGFRYRGVKVYTRENGGKHAALNLGLQCANGSVIVTVDADSRPEPTAIERMVAALVNDPDVGALSASVIAENDEAIIGRLQRVEYALSNTNRRAYSMFNAVPVVPGCLGVFRREALDDVWGFDPDTVTEDFDVTIKLLKAGWAVKHGPGRVSTIAPADWSSLWRQRLRWYQGGLETLRKHIDVFVDPRYRHLHAISFPIRLVSHLFTPVASYVILLAVVWGFVVEPSMYLVALVALFLLLTVLITLYSVILEKEPAWEVALAPLVFVGYKHFVDASIGVGTLRAVLRRDSRWE